MSQLTQFLLKGMKKKQADVKNLKIYLVPFLYSPDLQESTGVFIHKVTVKQLPRAAVNQLLRLMKQKMFH